MSSRPRQILIFVPLLAGLAGLLWWGFRGDAPSRVVRTADGREIILKAARFGSEHRFISGKPWQQLLYPILSTNLAARLGVQPFSFSNDTEVLVCWIELSPPGAPPTAAVADEHGYEAAPQSFIRSINVTPKKQVVGYSFSNFPRRGPGFRLRLFDHNRGGRELLAEFDVKNPARREYPTWTPEPLPSTRLAGAEPLTLLAFNTGLYATGGLARQCATWTEAEWRYGTEENPNGPWDPLWVELSDATGNSVRKREPMQRIVTEAVLPGRIIRDRGALSLPGVLWLDEAAWKLRVEYRQSRLANFSAENLWKLQGIPVPPEGGITEVDARTNLAQGTLFFRGISAAAVAYPGERTFALPTVHVQVMAPYTGAFVDLIKVTDDRGSNVWAEVSPLSARRHNYSLRRLSPEARTLDLTFALQQSQTVEFMVKPALLRTNIARSRL